MQQEPDVSHLFGDTYRPVRLPWTYRPVAALVVLLALFQPLAYVGIMAAVAHGTYWWILNGGGIVGLGGRVVGRASLFVLLIQLVLLLAPIVTGALVTLLMIGALIPSRGGGHRPGYVLAPIEQPLLYAYVNRLCDIMGAPRPVRIELTSDANASASFDGDWAWLVRRKMVLTLGMTLMQGMRRRELTGVIAHELGHFTQGVGMRSTRIVGAINAWFYRVVHRRGAVDDVVESMLEVEFWAISLLGMLVAIAMTLVRWVVLAIASVSRLATMALLRRMEFAADRCHARVSGSAAFASGFARIIELDEGYHKAIEVAQMESAQSRLPEDFADLAVKISPKAERDANGFLSGFQESGSVWSTHPPTDERVDAALRADEAGIVLNDGPALKLLRDTRTLSREVTRKLHEQVIGDSLARFRMLTTDEVLGRGEASPEAILKQAQESGPQPVYRKAGERVIQPKPADDDVIPFADD